MLIDRDKAIEAVNTALFPKINTAKDAEKALKNLPPVQPERKKGKWYKPAGYPRDSYRFICTNCQYVAYFVTGNNGKKRKEDHPKCGYRFCPNCGAEMTEGEDDD